MQNQLKIFYLQSARSPKVPRSQIYHVGALAPGFQCSQSPWQLWKLHHKYEQACTWWQHAPYSQMNPLDLLLCCWQKALPLGSNCQYGSFWCFPLPLRRCTTNLRWKLQLVFGTPIASKLRKALSRMYRGLWIATVLSEYAQFFELFWRVLMFLLPSTCSHSSFMIVYNCYFSYRILQVLCLSASKKTCSAAYRVVEVEPSPKGQLSDRVGGECFAPKIWYFFTSRQTETRNTLIHIQSSRKKAGKVTCGPHALRVRGVLSTLLQVTLRILFFAFFNQQQAPECRSRSFKRSEFNSAGPSVHSTFLSQVFWFCQFLCHIS